MKLPPLLFQQSILILAPHPDDEVLMAAGLIRRGVLQGAKISVCIVTDGNYLCLDGSKASLRRSESLAALHLLGVGEKDVWFLGYPDTGMEPELSFLHNLYLSGRYAGYQKVCFQQDLDGVLSATKPTLIVTASRWDMHGDHAGLFHFTRDAVMRLAESERPEVLQSLIHSPAGDGKWPQPDTPVFTIPPGLEQLTKLKWDERIQISLPEDMLKDPMESHLKMQAIQAYRSQLNFEQEPEVARYLLAFAKQEEIFWRVKDEYSETPNLPH